MKNISVEELKKAVELLEDFCYDRVNTIEETDNVNACTNCPLLDEDGECICAEPQQWDAKWC